MNALPNNLTDIILHLEAERRNGDTSFPVHQLERTISTFSSMYSNIVSQSFDKDLSNDLDAIMRWSIDCWPWENWITINTWRIIEEYSKIKKQSHLPCDVSL